MLGFAIIMAILRETTPFCDLLSMPTKAQGAYSIAGICLFVIAAYDALSPMECRRRDNAGARCDARTAVELTVCPMSQFNRTPGSPSPRRTRVGAIGVGDQAAGD